MTHGPIASGSTVFDNVCVDVHVLAQRTRNHS